MGNNHHGFSNEENISTYLNNKNFESLNKNMQEFIAFIFNGPILGNELISSGLTNKIERKNPKADIYIKIKNEIKYISIKEGFGNSVHQEPLDEFCEFLTELNISENSINGLKLYHYGDNTLNGNGETRLSSSEIKLKYASKIKDVNKELNSKNNLKCILNRILFAGVFKNPIIVDAIYHGSIEFGVYASREEITNYLLTNVDLFNMSGIKFSELTYQPWTRDQFKTAAHPERRYVMQVKWGSMTNCINEISRRRKNNGNK